MSVAPRDRGASPVAGRLTRDGTALAYETAGAGEPAVVLLHGIACHRAFMAPQAQSLSAEHRTVALDLRGHGDSDAPRGRYTIAGLADDVAWVCERLGIETAVVIGHSLGGLVALELAASRPQLTPAAIMIDSVLLPAADRRDTVAGLVRGVQGPDGDRVLRDYFAALLGPDVSSELRDWVLDQAVRTPSHVTSSVWNESLRSWDDARALAACRGQLLYIDSGTPNADLRTAVGLSPGLSVARAPVTGHFAHLTHPRLIEPLLREFIAAARRTRARAARAG